MLSILPVYITKGDKSVRTTQNHMQGADNVANLACHYGELECYSKNSDDGCSARQRLTTSYQYRHHREGCVE